MSAGVWIEIVLLRVKSSGMIAVSVVIVAIAMTAMTAAIATIATIVPCLLVRVRETKAAALRRHLARVESENATRTTTTDVDRADHQLPQIEWVEDEATMSRLDRVRGHLAGRQERAH